MDKKRPGKRLPHKLPSDLRKALSFSLKAKATWEDITLLARNEWICWIESAKLPETRKRRIKRALAELKGGMRRPCCWGGCPHR
ncbi:MAG TPA: YdeI/OmpD-associated family protein [Candidatus Moranbacteria bacterium]|nr:YdeI/OmpD-associated family protein [Candidatus Moranbacteria bacterium]